MDFFLISGAHDTGKTEGIYEIAIDLIARGYRDTLGVIPTPRAMPPIPDFITILEGNNAQGQGRRILINSATDEAGNIENLHHFYTANPSVDFIITSCRELNDGNRNYLFSLMNIMAPGNTLFEVPRGRITQVKANRPPVINWYQQNMLAVALRILETAPYNL